MQGRALTAPPMWRPIKKSTATKALVVEADYFPLTCKIDDNVIFWKPGFANEQTEIPPGIQYIWIARHVLQPIRSNLLDQAIKRGIEIWRCTILGLREKLLPIWADSINRSMITPANPGGDSDFEELPDLDLVSSDDDDIPLNALVHLSNRWKNKSLSLQAFARWMAKKKRLLGKQIRTVIEVEEGDP